jgi:hypothetical protein
MLKEAKKVNRSHNFSIDELLELQRIHIRSIESDIENLKHHREDASRLLDVFKDLKAKKEVLLKKGDNDLLARWYIKGDKFFNTSLELDDTLDVLFEILRKLLFSMRKEEEFYQGEER